MRKIKKSGRRKEQTKRIKPFEIEPKNFPINEKVVKSPQNIFMPMSPPQPYNMSFDMQSVNNQMLAKQHFKDQEEIRFLQEKSIVEIKKTVLKEHYLNQERMDLTQKKLWLNEYAKEARRASYDELIIGADGELSMQTQNLLVSIPRREISNFNFCEIYKLKSSNGKEGFYLLVLSVDSRKKEIYLDLRKAGKNSYLMEKITEAEGMIYANKPRQRQNILLEFWIKALSLCKKAKIIPENIGWIRDEEQRYKFISEGDLLWKDILKKSK